MQYLEIEGGSPVEIQIKDESVWVTQKGMAEIFGVSKSSISEHLTSIYNDRELAKDATVREFRTVRTEGDREVRRNLEHYSLDAIISVGYRVNSKKATQFRIWATGVIKQYIRDGYVIDETRLREDPKKLNKLAAKIRELRASEKNIYASVRECFKLAASDYTPTSKEVRRFYALLQDKFHHAVTEMTSAKLVMDRADHADVNMGMTGRESKIPRLSDAKIGKNYLREDELYRMHLLSEQFLLYAEVAALRGDVMTMSQLHSYLDNLLRLNGYPVFDDYKDGLRPQAVAHAEREHAQYVEIKKIEHLRGAAIDLESYYLGEYDEYKYEASKVSTQALNKALALKEKALKLVVDSENKLEQR